MYVDVHNHVLPSEVIDAVSAEPGYGVRVEDATWHGPHLVFPLVAEFFDPTAKLARLDEAGIDAAVVSIAPPAFLYDSPESLGGGLWDGANEGLARFCAGQPQRLHWLAHLPMQRPDEAVEAYRRAVRAGCVGAAVATSVAGRRLDGEEFERFWAVAAELDRPVLVHPWFNEAHPALNQYYLQNVIGNPLETTVVVERLVCAGVFRRHPGLRLVLMHGGGFLPYQTGRLAHARGVRAELADAPDPAEILACFDHLYFDTITHDPAALRYLVDRVGADHVALGTDLPYDMGLQTPMATLRDALPDDVVEQVAAGTPARLFGLTGATGPGAVPATPPTGPGGGTPA